MYGVNVCRCARVCVEGFPEAPLRAGTQTVRALAGSRDSALCVLKALASLWDNWALPETCTGSPAPQGGTLPPAVCFPRRRPSSPTLGARRTLGRRDGSLRDLNPGVYTQLRPQALGSPCEAPPCRGRALCLCRLQLRGGKGLESKFQWEALPLSGLTFPTTVNGQWVGRGALPVPCSPRVLGATPCPRT